MTLLLWGIVQFYLRINAMREGGIFYSQLNADFI